MFPRSHPLFASTPTRAWAPLLALPLLLTAAPGHAEIRFSGFMSVVGGMTLDDNLPAGEEFQGYDDSAGFKPESLFGLQADMDLTQNLAVTAQLVADGGKDFDVRANWAYLSYAIGSSSKVLAGRQRVPFYMYSDVLDVGLAYPWIRPPVGVYSLPFDNAEGAAFRTNQTLGAGEIDFHLFYGRGTDDLVVSTGLPPAGSDIDNLGGGAVSYTWEWLTLRASYFQGEATINVDQLTQLAGALSLVGFSPVADAVAIDEDLGKFSSLGAKADNGTLFAIAEYTELNWDDANALSDEESYYLTAGVRFAPWTVHATYGADENTPQLAALSSVPPGIALPGVPDLRAATDEALRTTEQDRTYYSLGVNYQLGLRSVLKVDYTQLDDDLPADEDVDLLTLGIDIIF